MTDAHGTYPDRHTFRLEMHYPHPPSRVWTAITDPEHLAAWFMPLDIELRVGGRVVLKDYGQRKAPPAEGRVTALVPEALLEYHFDKGEWEWPESTLRYELSAQADGCTLVFTQVMAPDFVPTWRDFASLQTAGPGTHIPESSAGWQGFFQEGLGRFLEGRKPPLYDDADDELMRTRGEQYRKVVEAKRASGEW